MQHMDIVSMVLVDRTEVQWVSAELSKLQSEIEKFKGTARNVFAPHCTSGLHKSNLHLLNHPLKNIESSGCT